MYSVTEEVIVWLTALGYRASTQVPEDAPKDPSEFVTIERTNGGVTNFVDNPQIAIQTWAETEARAEEMANEIKVAALTGELPVGVSSMIPDIGPYPFWDEETRCPRYQTVYLCYTHVVLPDN